ncbi:MAG: TlpA disulfide reductase family protein, partial [Lacibacter sp.]
DRNIRVPFCLVSLMLIGFLFGCKGNESEIIILHLDSVYIDTTYEAGMFRDIKTISKTYDSVNKRVKKITGVIEIPQMFEKNSQKGKIAVDLYLKEGKRLTRIDTDQDGDLSDEREYIVNETNEFINIPDVEVSGSKLKLYALPMQSGLFTPKDKYDLSFTGFNFLHIRKSGLLSLKNKYNITIVNVSESKYYNKAIIFFITEVGIKQKNELVYHIGDIIHLDRNVFKLKEVDSTGSVLKLEKIGVDEKQLGVTVGEYALPLTGSDLLTKREISLKDEPGKLTLLEFWGTWCGPCTKLTEEYNRLNKQYSKNLKIIGIAADPSAENVKNYIIEKQVNYPNIYEKMEDSLCTKYIVRSFPTYILIDSDGKIIFRAAGLDYFEDLKELIRKKIKN